MSNAQDFAMFSSRIFIVSCLTFKSLIHFEFIHVCGVTRCSSQFFCMYLSNIPNTIYWINVFFLFILWKLTQDSDSRKKSNLQIFIKSICNTPIPSKSKDYQGCVLYQEEDLSNIFRCSCSIRVAALVCPHLLGLVPIFIDCPSFNINSVPLTIKMVPVWMAYYVVSFCVVKLTPTTWHKFIMCSSF